VNLEQTKAHILAQKCEVCGGQATNLIQDIVEEEPDIVLGVAYRCSRPDGSHFFCKAHKRPAKLTEFFADDASTKEWLERHGVVAA
jgi:hypothetical protein